MMWIRAFGVALPALFATRSLSSESANALPISLTLTLDAASVIGGNSVNATITLSVAAPSGGALVTVTNPPGTTVQAGASQSGIQQVGSTKILVPAGQQNVTFRILTAGVAANSVATLVASSGSDQAAVALVITPARPKSIALAATFVVGGQSTTATVTLDGAAPVGGLDVPLTVAQAASGIGDGSVRSVGPAQPSAISVPAVAHFNTGASSTTVSVTTTAVPRDISHTITASLGGASASRTVTVKAPAVTAVQLAPATVVAGNGSTGTVVLSGQAAPGMIVLLSSASTAAAVPPQVSVAPGATTATFPITTVLPNSGSTAVLTIPIDARIPTPATTGSIADGSSNTIQLGETAATSRATLTVLPPVVVQSTNVTPASVTGGSPITLAINVGIAGAPEAILITGPTTVVAGTAQIVVDQPSLVQLPATVTIPGRPGSITVNGTTTPPTADATVNIRTTFGATTVSSAVLVKAPIPALESFAVRTTKVTGGNNVLASVKLSPSVTQTTLVTLATDRPDLIQLPKSVLVPATGVALTLTFTTSAVTTPTAVLITAVAGTQKLIAKVDIVP